MSTWQAQDAEKHLADNEIHIWLNFLNLHQAKLKHLYPLLSAAEKLRSEKFSHFRARKNYIASHGFLHTVLSDYIDIPASEIEFLQEDKGKPFIDDSLNPRNIQFNLSHSGNLAILAVCRQHAVGIDLECEERNSDWAAIARRFFTEREKQAFFALPEERQKPAFYKIWTRKEAHMKVTGKGLSLPPTQFEVSVPPAPARFLNQLSAPDDRVYKMQDIELPDMYTGYHACLSANFDYAELKLFLHA